MSLKGFDTLYELADARKLGGIGCGDQRRMSGHLCFQKSEKTKQNGIVPFVCLCFRSRRPGREQHLAVGKDGCADFAFKFGVRFKKSRIQAYAFGVSHRRDLA